MFQLGCLVTINYNHVQHLQVESTPFYMHSQMAFRTIYLSGKLSKTTAWLIHSYSDFSGRVSSTGGLFTCTNPNRSHRHCPSSLCRGCLLSACAVGLAFLGSMRLIEHVLQRMWRHFYVQEILGKNTMGIVTHHISLSTR